MMHGRKNIKLTFNVLWVQEKMNPDMYSLYLSKFPVNELLPESPTGPL